MVVVLVMKGGGSSNGDDDEVENDIDVRWRKPATERDPNPG